MPKQVRLRRGTTAQHAAFTGADGEVTFDSTKKVIVVHDGVTAGGKPVDGFVVLDPGAPLSGQEIKSRLTISGGDDDSDAFTVAKRSQFGGTVSVDELLYVRRISLQQETIIYAGTINLNFATFGQKNIELAGNLALTASNMINGAQMMVRLKCDTSLRTLTFPVGWRWIGATVPANIAASKLAMLWLWCFGTTASDVMARYLVEP